MHIDLIKPVPQKNDTAAKIKVARDFENFFFGQILKNLYKDRDESALFGDGPSADIVKGFWIDAISSACSSKSLGIADKILQKSHKGIYDARF